MLRDVVYAASMQRFASADGVNSEDPRQRLVPSGAKAWHGSDCRAEQGCTGVMTRVGIASTTWVVPTGSSSLIPAALLKSASLYI